MMSRIQSSLSFMMKTDYFGFNLVTRLTYPPIPPPLLPPSPLPFSPFSSPPLLSHSLFCFPAKIILRCWSCHSIKSTLERPQPDSLACVTIASHFKFLIINFLYNLVTKSFFLSIVHNVRLPPVFLTRVPHILLYIIIPLCTRVALATQTKLYTDRPL